MKVVRKGVPSGRVPVNEDLMRIGSRPRGVVVIHNVSAAVAARVKRRVWGVRRDIVASGEG